LRSWGNDTAWSINAEGTRHVVDACRACGVQRLVHFSSIHALAAPPRDAVLDESFLLCHAPNAPLYDRSKAAAEQSVLTGVAQGLDAVIVNPTAVFGPGDYAPSPMGRFLIDLHNRRLPALVSGGFNWVDVRDVCDGAMAAAQRGRTGERYLLAGHYLSIRNLAALCAAITGIPAPRLTAPRAWGYLAVPFAGLAALLTGQPARWTAESLRALGSHQHVSSAKAARELAYQPRPLRDSLADTYAWFDAQGDLRHPTSPPSRSDASQTSRASGTRCAANGRP
jgi:dihydroflavonol-4-reductase